MTERFDASDIFNAYFGFFAEQPDIVFKDFTNAALWTLRATTALVHVGLQAFPNSDITAKGHADRNTWSRSEYMNLDVTLNDKNSWKAPLFVAEHENSGARSQIQYDAWKLLSVEAQRRVLVAYWGRGTEFKTFDELNKAVHEVCADQPGKDILLIGGQCDALPKTATEFKAAHVTSIVGLMRVN